jgi:hypothetical protein
MDPVMRKDTKMKEIKTNWKLELEAAVMVLVGFASLATLVFLLSGI